MEVQTVKVEMMLEQEDKFIITTLLFAISMLVKYSNGEVAKDPEYKMISERFDQTVIMMSQRKYPIAQKLADAPCMRQSKQQQAVKK